MFSLKEREAARRSEFKKFVDSNDARRRRQEHTVQIRRNKKAEQLMKRRAGAGATATGASVQSQDSSSATAVSVASSSMPPSSSSSSPSSSSSQGYKLDDLPLIMRQLNDRTSNDETILTCIRSLRRILSVEKNVPARQVIEAGAMAYLLQCLQREDCPDLIFEAAWALTNIASTSETKAVVESGAVPLLIKLTAHIRADIREQCAWALGNIAGDNYAFRDTLIQQGVLHPLIMNLRAPQNISLLGNVTWSVSNMCRGKPQPALADIQAVIEPLAQLFPQPAVTVEVLVDAAWALSYISDGPDERIQAVLDSGVTANLVKLLADTSSAALVPTIRCLGNLVTGNDTQTQAVLDAGVLEYVVPLFGCQRKTVRKELCWMLSNIAAGTKEQIDALFRTHKVVDCIVSAASEAVWEVRKEALYAVSNMATGADDMGVCTLVGMSGLEPLSMAMASAYGEPKLLMVVLDAIDKILEVGQRYGREYHKDLEEHGGLDLVEGLQEHSSDDVYAKAVHIIEKYYGSDDDDDHDHDDDRHGDENMLPPTSIGLTFSPGVSKQLFPLGQGEGSVGVEHGMYFADTTSQQQQQQQQPMFNFAAPVGAAGGVGVGVGVGGQQVPVLGSTATNASYNAFATRS